ncbi:MAG: hypothetical protein F4151_12710 [Gammaproteobacteria bacterium]|nr:hypothetical protein [Acidobacteriota bacterium]MYH50352.1 hypothetical protein [Gammaproteobacteria bacterium]
MWNTGMPLAGADGVESAPQVGSGRPWMARGKAGTSPEQPPAKTRAIAALVALAAGVLPVAAYGYTFFSGIANYDYNATIDYGDGPKVLTAAEAARWDSSVWPRGDSLEWMVAEGPWTEPYRDIWHETHDSPFRSVQEVVDLMAEALEVWEAVESADIRWEVNGARAVPGAVLDGRNTMSVRPDDPDDPPGTGRASQAFLWASRNVSGSWAITECDVWFPMRHAASFATDDNDSLRTAIHEFGHCLGLNHPASHDEWRHWGAVNPVGVYGPTPVMSYGWSRTNELSQDDIAGASLLRPAPGTAPAPGSIAGELTLAGEPARYVYVFASRLDEGSLRGGVGAFSAEDGRFVVEGLAPGDYLLRAQPILSGAITGGGACAWLLEGQATLDVRDLLRLDPVTVSPGGVSSAGVMELQPGRTGSPRLAQ